LKDKEYYLNEEEKKAIELAFENGIQDTIEDYFDNKYGYSLYSEDDLRARLYFHIARWLEEKTENSKKLIASINLETKTNKKVEKRPGELDMTSVNPVAYKHYNDVIVCLEIKFIYGFKPDSKKEEMLEYIRKLTSQDKSDDKHIYKCLFSGKIRSDLKKLENELKEGAGKAYLLIFDGHKQTRKYEIEKARRVKEFFIKRVEDALDERIIWIYVLRYYKFERKCPFGKTGIVKSNEKFFEDLSVI